MVWLWCELTMRRGNHVVSFPDDPNIWIETQPGSSMLRLGELWEPGMCGIAHTAARILCVASLMYEACVTGVTITKR